MTTTTALVCIACSSPYVTSPRPGDTYTLCPTCLPLAWSRDALREADRIESARRHVLASAPQTLTLQQWLAIIGRYAGRCALCTVTAYSVLAVWTPEAGLTAHNVVPLCKSCEYHRIHNFANALERVRLELHEL